MLNFFGQRLQVRTQESNFQKSLNVLLHCNPVKGQNRTSYNLQTVEGHFNPGLFSMVEKSGVENFLFLLGLKSSWLKIPGLKGLGLKLGVEKSGVEMSFNLG